MTNASDALTMNQKPATSGTTKLQGSTLRRALALFCSVAALATANVDAAPFAYVANNSDGNVSVVDLSTGATVTKITVGTNPLGVTLNPAGTKAYVSNFNSGTVSVIDTATNTAAPTTITVGNEPELLAVSHDGATLYVANLLDSTVSFVDTATNAQTSTVKVNGHPAGIAVSPTGDKVYVTLPNASKVDVITTSSKTVTSSVNVGLNPLGIVLSADGSKAYVANFGSDTVSVFDTATGAIAATVDVGISPNGIAINPQGTFIYVSNSASDTISVISTTDNTVVAAIPVGIAPLGISIDSNGAYGYVTSGFEGALYVLDLSVNVANGTMATGTTPTYSAITSSTALSVNLNQHGLTGTWYDPSTSGQGLVVEVYADNVAPGQGTFSAGWFTFDTAAAGGQRWYTLQGSVKPTDTAAALSIYSATGGNFNAAPGVTASLVGQATIQFTDCKHGLLSYTFSDGSNRKGFVPLTRLTFNTTCSATGDNGTAPSSYLLSGGWYNPATSGQGLQFDISPSQNLIAGAWYTFAPNGQQTGGGASQRWYTLQALGFIPGSTSISSVPIVETTGGVFHNPTAVTRTPVGTANISFQSCSAMTVAYSFTAGTNTGLSGTLNLVRVGPTPAGCTLQ